MEAYQDEIVDLNPEVKKHMKRRSLLPWWIKAIIWIFMLVGALTPLGLVFGILGNSFDLSLYGFKTYQQLSVVGLGLTAILVLKGMVALGLWTEKVWAVKLGQYDAILGIILCLFEMLIYPVLINEASFGLRLELVLLIPYLIRLNKIKDDWEQ